MPDRYAETHIRNIPLFSQLPEDQFQLVARTFQVRRYRAGELIFRQGDASKGMYLFLDGTAVLIQQTPDGANRRLGTLRRGQAFNEQGLFKDGTHTATLQAVESVSTLFLARHDLASLLAHHPEITASLGLSGGKAHHVHDVKFKTQRENEQVLLKTRRHAWAYARWLPLPFLLMAMGIIAALTVTPLAPVFLCLSLVIPGLMSFYIYIEWANDSVIITTQRVIRITHTILSFTEVVSEIPIESVQEANYEIPARDLFALVFKYGDVEIKTSGQAGNLMLSFMPDPKAVQDLIMEDHHIRTAQQEASEREQMRAHLERWIGGDDSVAPPSQPQTPTPAATGESGGLPFFRTRFVSESGAIGYRRHWIVWLRGVLPSLMVMGLAFVLMLVNILSEAFRSLGFIGWIIAFVVFVVGFLWFIFADWDWRNDYMLVDDKTVSFVHQRPLWLQNENDQVLLKQVDNVVAESSGIMSRIYGYGKVRLALVGADSHKIFDRVPRPLDIQSEVTRRQSRLNKREEEERDRLERERLADYFSLYHEMTGTTPDGAPPQPGQPSPAASRPQPARPAAPSPDRSRPPRVPVNRPAMSPGKPYQPRRPAPANRVRPRRQTQPPYAPPAGYSSDSQSPPSEPQGPPPPPFPPAGGS